VKSGDPPNSLIRPDRALVRRAQETRERVIARLSDHFAHDALDVDEFERRVAVAQTSENPSDIEALLGDLPDIDGPPAPATAIVPTVVPALLPEDSDRDTLYAVFGGIDRRGTWTVPRRMRIVAIFGGAHLDLREARFPPGVVDIDVTAVMGGIEIVVPPGLAVQMHGSAIMGGFADINRAPANPDPDAPLLRVRGLTVMGGVDVSMRLPGESERGARRRERSALRAERQAQRLLDRDRGHDR
jgi:cell wall-active antibiotic response 4TMS protein YvqF/uncharacterized protein DUF1707